MAADAPREKTPQKIISHDAPKDAVEADRARFAKQSEEHGRERAEAARTESKKTDGDILGRNLSRFVTVWAALLVCAGIFFGGRTLWRRWNAPSSVVVLGAGTFNDQVSNARGGAFVKFYAPWCGHCKKMAPAWDKLAAAYVNSTVLIGDIDCTLHKKFCGTQGVRGFPTLKYFAGTTSGQKYDGKRDYAALSKFAKDKLGPSCHVDTPELCSADEKATLDEYVAMAGDARAEMLAERLRAIDTLKASVAELRAHIPEEIKKHKAARKELRQSIIMVEGAAASAP